MIFTLKDALRLECLKDTKIVAGEQGLLKEIRFVNVMEVPDIVDWISEDELLLTTGYPYKDMKINWEELLVTLSKKKLTALGIKPNRFIKIIPQEVIQAGNDLGIPILQLSPNAQFDLIIKEVLREIINNDYKYIKEGEKIHRLFTNLILSGGDLKEIIRTLAEITNSQVSLVNDKKEIIEEAIFHNHNISNSLMNTYELNQKSEINSPIYIYDKITAYINMTSCNGVFGEVEKIAFDRAIEAVSMIFLKRLAANEIEKNYRNDFLNDVVDGEIKTRDIIIERGKFFDMDLSSEYLLFYIDVDSFEKVFIQNLKNDEKKSHYLLTNLFEFVFSTFFSKAKNSIIWERSDSIILLYPVKNYSKLKSEENDTKESLKAKALNLAQQIKNKVDSHIKDFTISIGIGSFYSDIIDINKSYREAQESIRLGKLIWGDNGIYHHDNLGIYKILMQCKDKNELKLFVNKNIGKLVDYDLEKNTQFLITLEHLIRNDCNLKLVSEKIFIHPKTVAYRKKRIEEILGISLDNIDEKLSIYIALKIKDIIDV